jgi:hypothetical protein
MKLRKCPVCHKVWRGGEEHGDCIAEARRLIAAYQHWQMREKMGEEAYAASQRDRAAAGGRARAAKREETTP